MNEQKSFMLIDRIGYSLLFVIMVLIAFDSGNGWIMSAILSFVLLVNRWDAYKRIKFTPK